MIKRRKRLLWIIPAVIVGIAVFIFVGGELVMRLWNWLLPMLFGWRQITFWQAVGLLALCRILFGGWGGRRHYGPGHRMAARWAQMTPEEREKFRQGFRGRCTPFEPPDTSPTA
jgi:hypothetical protein